MKVLLGNIKGEKGEPGENATTTENATQSKAGLESAEDKKNLDRLTEMLETNALDEKIQQLIEQSMTTIKSHVGMIIQSTTLDTVEKVISIYGGTEWVKIEGKMLLGVSESHAVNSTGGSETHKLTTAELPSHNHSFSGSGSSDTQGAHSHGISISGTTGDNGSHTHGVAVSGTTASAGNHSHSFDRAAGATNSTFKYASGSISAIALTTASRTGTASAGSHTHSFNGSGNTSTSGSHSHSFSYSGNTGSNGGHNHNITVSGTIGNTGSGNAFNIMPPYKTVYIWERTA